MITTEQALHFAQHWINTWNTHNPDRIMDLYADDLEMISPFVVTLLKQPTGILKGREMIRGCLEKALILMPNLKYELLEVFSSVYSISICYKALFGKRAVEVLFFDPQGKISRSIAHYTVI